MKSIQVMYVLCLVIALSGCASVLKVDKHKPKSDQRIVEAVPPGSLSRPAIDPYSRAHPRLLIRPDETFEFPIAIGQTGPVAHLFAGELRYPFLCQTEESGLGQPLVDNQVGHGVPVVEMIDGESGERVLGHSKDCSLRTQAQYFYNKVDTDEFFAFDDSIPTEQITQLDRPNGQIPFIVRVEWGTINRYIYTLATLKGAKETLARPSPDRWNGKLILAFRGGVGIGFKQGNTGLSSVIEERIQELAKGYGLVTSTGLKTSNHYHIWESEDLALRLKRQFAGLYGKPTYTVGIGASGGAISQYLLAQNRPGIIDGAIAQYAYPDMVSQTIYALDCDLLEHYFDIGDRGNTFWDQWENRSLIEGLSAKSVEKHEFAKLYQWSKLMNGFLPTKPRGVSECVYGWRGPAQVAHNPKYTHYYHRFDPEIVEQAHWSHWENLRDFYGTDEAGFANALWDNEGVQYGLAALNNGKIDFRTFIDLNRHVGSWRAQSEMQVAKFWKFSGEKDRLTDVNIWSNQNMRKGSKSAPAPRTRANPAAIEGAYRSGMIFTGIADIPILDIRHYVDDIQDMHHSFASFTSRARIIAAQGNADHQGIWMAKRDFDPTALAFKVIDQWVLAKQAKPKASLAALKPTMALDRCFAADGKVLHAGVDVFDGEWNQRPAGACMQLMPSFKSSRQVAGEDIQDQTFKCQLVPVRQALAKGVYKQTFDQQSIAVLEKTFPSGVCDYAKLGEGELSAKALGLTNSSR